MPDIDDARWACPHQETCGACALLGRSHAEQLALKRSRLEREMRRYRSLSGVRLLEGPPSPEPVGYRNRVRMAVGLSRHGGASLGYFRAGTREIVDAPECGVLVPALLETTRRIRSLLLSSRNVPRSLRHVDLRCGSDPDRQHLTLVFRATELPPFPLEALRRAVPKVDGISYNLNPSAGPQVLHGSVKHLWGQREVWIEHGPLRLRVSPGSFFQVNLSVLPQVHELMDRYFQGGRLLVDLYAGVGTHGLALAGKFRRVVFAEGTRSAVADLKASSLRNGLDDFDVLPTAVERSLDKLREHRPAAVVLNPSRVGAGSSVLDWIAASGARQVAYLSCDPGTLFRDLDLLHAGGLETVSVQPVDMMPQTNQIEALALLRRIPGFRPRPTGRRPVGRRPAARRDRKAPR